MNKKILLIIFLGVFSCKKTSNLERYYTCNTSNSFKELKTQQDFKKKFTIKVPKHWKTNLYFDDSRSSIQIADTTKNLTSTSLIGYSIMHSSINFSTKFKAKINTENIQNGLENIVSETTFFKEKPAFINIAKGKRGKYPYQIANIFAQLNDHNFLQISTEVYGDSLVSQRFCNALFLIDKIQLN